MVEVTFQRLARQGKKVLFANKGDEEIKCQNMCHLGEAVHCLRDEDHQFIYKHVDIYFLAGGQATAWREWKVET